MNIVKLVLVLLVLIFILYIVYINIFKKETTALIDDKKPTGPVPRRFLVKPTSVSKASNSNNSNN